MLDVSNLQINSVYNMCRFIANNLLRDLISTSLSHQYLFHFELESRHHHYNANLRLKAEFLLTTRYLRTTK